MEHTELVINTLKANGALRSGEIAEKSGLLKSEVEKVVKKLKADDIIFSPRRCFYDIKS